MTVRVFETASVSGFLHEAAGTAGLALTHGAGTNCRSPLLIAVAEAFASAGVTVLRFDLEFRRRKPFGPPHPSAAPLDRESIRLAAEALREEIAGPVYAGGHSYGGRQASMLAAENRALCRALLLLSYPLHPPRQPERPRTGHFPHLRTPAVFVHGDRDPFGTLEEMEAARRLIPASNTLIAVDNAGHDLKKGQFDVAGLVTALLENWNEAA